MRAIRKLMALSVCTPAAIAAWEMYMIPNAWMLGAAAGVVGVAATIGRKAHRYTAYGRSRWAEAKDIPELLSGDGIPIGHIESKPSVLKGILALRHGNGLNDHEGVQTFLQSIGRLPARKLVRLSTSVHVAAFSPPGGGKSTGLALPFLLTCPDSMVVVDFKGELARGSMEARRRMGHRIVLLDPFEVVTKKPDTYNPLDGIHASSRLALSEAEDLANDIVTRTGKESEPYWCESAINNIASVVALVLATAPTPAKRSLVSVRQIIANPQQYKTAIKAMCASSDWGGALATKGHALSNHIGKELASSIVVTGSHLKWIENPMVADSVSSSSFDPADLLNGKMTIYLILPPEHIISQMPLIRLWLGAMFREMTKGGVTDRHVQFLIDEAGAIGPSRSLDIAAAQLRGYGVQLLLLYQSIGQLKRCFPDGQDTTLLSNVTQLFMGINDKETAEYVSARLGDHTLVIENDNDGSGTSDQFSQQGNNSHGSSKNWGRSRQQIARRLMKPEEITTMHPRLAITFVPSTPPIMTWTCRSFEHDYHDNPGVGFWKAAFETAWMLAVAVASVYLGYLMMGE